MTFVLVRPLALMVRNVARLHPRAALVVVLGAVGLLVGLGLGTAWFLRQLQGLPIGGILAHHLLSMMLFSLQFLLGFSALINALSAFYLSKELDGVWASPAPPVALFHAKLLETWITAAWMVEALLVPVLLAYGLELGAPGAYFLVAPLLPLPFLFAMAALGASVAMLLARFLPARRTWDLMRFFAVLSAALLVVLFRLLQPERLVEPGEFEKLAGYLVSLHPRELEWFPSYWLTEVVFAFLRFDFEFLFPRHATLTLATAAVAYGLARFLFATTWKAGWLKFQEAPPPPPKTPGRLLDLLLAPARRLPPGIFALVAKETKIYARSPVVWTQVALMGVIVLIYAYNLYLVPVATLEHLQPGITGLVAFCNAGFIGFLVVAAALRFGFPTVSMEGEGFLLVHTSPLGIDRYLAAKYWLNVVPLAALGLVLAVLAHVLLAPGAPLAALGYLDALLFAATIGWLAMDFSAEFRDLKATNFAHLPSGPGGIAFLVAALALVATVMALQGYPFWLYREARTFASPPDGTRLAMGAASGLASVLVAWGAARVARGRALASLAKGLS